MPFVKVAGSDQQDAFSSSNSFMERSRGGIWLQPRVVAACPFGAREPMTGRRSMKHDARAPESRVPRADVRCRGDRACAHRVTP